MKMVKLSPGLGISLIQICSYFLPIFKKLLILFRIISLRLKILFNFLKEIYRDIINKTRPKKYSRITLIFKLEMVIDNKTIIDCNK